VCDSLCALAPATAGQVTLFAKNSDRPPTEPQRLEQHPPRRDRGTVRTTYVEVEAHATDTIGLVGSRPAWMWGFEHGVNEAGVAIGNETIYTTLDPRRFPPALTGMDLVRLGLERATTAAGALEIMTALLERYGQGGSGHEGADDPYWSSFLVADPTTAFVLETSGREWATEAVERIRAISNRTTIPDFDARHRHPRQPVERLVDPRWHASQKVLAEEPVTVSAVTAHLRSHVGEDGYTVCMHARDDQATTASLVVELPTAPGHPLARWCLAHPCTSVYVPVYVGRPLGEPLAWEQFAALGPEHRPALDELEFSLAADCADDVAWGQEAWRRVRETVTALLS